MAQVFRMPLALLLLGVGCLPADPPGFERDGGAAPHAERPEKGRPAKLLPASTERGPEPSSGVDAGGLLTDPFRDDFEREALGPDWNPTSKVWHIEEGRLCGRGAKNHPVWLLRRLPVNARIELDVTSGSPDGDIKVEVWGDGRSAASSTTYDDATSYLAILGGWKNRLNVLARLNEHGATRKEVRLLADSEDPRTQRVVEGRSYHVKLERADGRTVSFSVDDTLIHEFVDPAPLTGPGHEHLGFNDWDVPLCFDDLSVTPL